MYQSYEVKNMKIAIFSDIHGNMQALDAVMADIKKEKCDKMFCLGDIAMAGPEPIKAIQVIKDLYDKGSLELIQGNTDEMIGDGSAEIINKVKSAFPIMGEALEDDCKIIPDDLKTFLKDLPKQKMLELEGLKILLVHGSPRRNDENILPNMPLDEVEEILSGVDVNVIFCGHTHMPCGYHTNSGKTLVNDGSVGRPFTENPQSCYVIAIINNGKLEITHKFVDYDKKTASEILSKRNFKGADKLAQILINPEHKHI